MIGDKKPLSRPSTDFSGRGP